MGEVNRREAVDASIVDPATKAKFWGGAILRRERAESKEPTLPGWLGHKGLNFMERLEIRAEARQRDQDEMYTDQNDNNVDVGGEEPIAPQEEI